MARRRSTWVCRAAVGIASVSLVAVAWSPSASGRPVRAVGVRAPIAASATGVSGAVVGIAGLCLDDDHSGTANGTKVQVWSCNGTAAQSWSLPGDGTIRVLGKCLDDDHSGTTNGNKIQIYACNGGAAQRWTSASDGTLKVLGRCLDVLHSGKSNGTPVQLYSCNGSAAQRWHTPGSTFTAVTKVLTVVEENHSLAQMQSGMPYLYSLAQRFAYATHYTAIRHPSEPNYLAIGGGSTFGDTSDHNPAFQVRGQSVFGQAASTGKSARAYSESQTSPCQQSSSGTYAVKHNPWASFTDERALCLAGDVGSGSTTSGPLLADVTAGTLPRVGLLVPNLDHDAHDGSLATADAWLKGWLPRILAGPDFTSGRLVVVVTADEDDNTPANTVLTTVLHRSLDGRHAVVATSLTHYSLTRLYSQAVCTPALRAAATATDMASAFGLPTSC